MQTVTLSLVSHTNVGKTTLARTLLRRDIGEVLDHAHVTEVNEAYELIETKDARLLLWDTPGFGDSARLLRRLQKENGAVGWFLHQVWDRARDRPLWCSQEALRNVKNDADIVLYLVNAAEDPEDAGYVRHELEILSWVERPVLVLLNQTGAAGRSATQLEEGWRAFTSHWSNVQGVLSLDAFSRGWLQEDVLFETVVDALPEDKQPAMRALAAAWAAQNRAVFDASVRTMAAHLARAATDREALSKSASKRDKERAMTVLTDRLKQSDRDLWDSVIMAHGLEGRAATEVRERLEDFRVEGNAPISTTRSAVIGGAVSGAISGIAADLMTGGLSLGGGLVAGTILGALGAAGLSQGFQWLGSDEEPAIHWSTDFLDKELSRVVLRYIAVAHFGRGRGVYRDVEHPEHWRAAVDAAVGRHRTAFAATWRSGSENGIPVREALSGSLHSELSELILAILRR